MPQKQVLTVLGATGSIGLNTLDVVARHADQFEVFALSGFKQIDKLAELCETHHPKFAVVSTERDATLLRTRLSGAVKVEVIHGVDSLEWIASASEVTTVMAAIVGAAGLRPTLAAAKAGKRVLLANKEVLVMAGDVFMNALRSAKGVLLPIDSEHNAIFQSLPNSFNYGLDGCGISKLLLTASGGPFRSTPYSELQFVTPEQACAHPNWVMGRKISVDSATMMNKGLEVIEASRIFGVGAEQIEVVIHPESVIHSMVSYMDGSVLAQLGNPDMRTPIAHALAYPERMSSGVAPLDLARIGKLTFEAPDFERFPCLALAFAALKAGGNAPATLNAANEIAVSAFLDSQLRFDQIAAVVSEVMATTSVEMLVDLDAVLAADEIARTKAECAVMHQRSKS